MKEPQFFKTIDGQKLPLPVFFPDATKGVIKTLDSTDIEKTKTLGILVNTYHLYRELGRQVIEKHGGIRQFMGWEGAVISDSGGFQVMSLAKASGKRGNITDNGVTFQPQGSKKIILTPEKSISFQMVLKSDMVVVLDDFTPPGASYKQAQETVRRTILWARRSKEEFVRCCEEKALTEEHRPYILAVVQGGDYLDLRNECAENLE